MRVGVEVGVGVGCRRWGDGGRGRGGGGEATHLRVGRASTGVSDFSPPADSPAARECVRRVGCGHHAHVCADQLGRRWVVLDEVISRDFDLGPAAVAGLGSCDRGGGGLGLRLVAVQHDSAARARLLERPRRLHLATHSHAPRPIVHRLATPRPRHPLAIAQRWVGVWQCTALQRSRILDLLLPPLPRPPLPPQMPSLPFLPRLARCAQHAAAHAEPLVVSRPPPPVMNTQLARRTWL